MRNTWAHCDVGGTVSAGVGPQPRGPEKSPPSSGPRFLYRPINSNNKALCTVRARGCGEISGETSRPPGIVRGWALVPETLRSRKT